MRAPVLPYYGDQFLGVKPPTPFQIKHNYPAGSGLSANPRVVIPCVDANDGSYLIIDNTGTNGSSMIKRYNPANALVWSLDVWPILTDNYSQGRAINCGFCYDSTSNRYYLPFCEFNDYNSVTRAGILYVYNLSTGAHQTKGMVVISFGSLAGSAITAAQTSITAAGYLSIIYNGKELLFDVNTGSSSVLTINNNGILLPNGINYRSSDGTIYCSPAYMMPSGIAVMDIIRNGYQIKVPINWVKPSILTAGVEYNTVSPIILGDYIYFAEYSKQFAAGIKTVKRTEFDAWLRNVCDAMGL